MKDGPDTPGKSSNPQVRVLLREIEFCHISDTLERNESDERDAIDEIGKIGEIGPIFHFLFSLSLL